MVPSYQQKLGRHEQLLSEEVGHDLEAVVPPVYIVPEEEEGGWGQYGTHPPQHLLKTDEVMEITVEITWVTGEAEGKE